MIVILFLGACPLGTVSPVNNPLIGILVLRNNIAGYLFVQCYRGEKNGFDLFWGDTTSTVHTSRVCAWRSPHRTENSGIHPLDISQDETLIPSIHFASF